MFVRALYNYETDDPTSLSFREGDNIQVLKQLDSGWWDGIVHGQRGWFPSNYCTPIEEPDYTSRRNLLDDSDDLGAEDSYDDYGSDDDEEDIDDLHSPGLPMEGTDDRENDPAAFWIPQATPDGRLYYFNTQTGASRADLPLDAPTSTTETGPADRSNVAVGDQTRAPAEMLGGAGAAETNGINHDHDSDSDVEGLNGTIKRNSGKVRAMPAFRSKRVLVLTSFPR